MMWKWLDVWKIMPVVLLVCITSSWSFADELPLIPIQSSLLHEKATKLEDWKKQVSLASKLPYFSNHSQKVAIEQYLINAKIFMIDVAVRALFLPLEKLELQRELFESNVFEFSQKYCAVDLRTNLDWGALVRQMYINHKKQRATSRWDDSWSKGSFPLEIQQKLYTARITKSLDAIKSLCSRENSSVESIVKFFLQDDVIALNVTNQISNSNKPKFYCESAIFCREISHQEFMKRLPRSMLDLEFRQEMLNLWKTSVEQYSANWESLKQINSSISKFATEQARRHLREELIGVSDFFSLTALMTKNTNDVLDDPILKSIRPLINQLVTSKIQAASNKVTWEDPLEIILEKSLDSNSELALDIKAVKGGFDKMIDKLDKFKISDQIVFDRGFIEWFLRATLNIRYYNEQLYWSNMESIQHHLNQRFQHYISQRKDVLPYLSYEKNMSLYFTKWFLDNRNDIAEKLMKNPEKKSFPLIINHYLGLSALETRMVGE